MFIFVNHLNDYTTTYICINVTINLIGINHIPSFISSSLNICVPFHNLYIHTCMICCHIIEACVGTDTNAIVLS